MVATFLITYMFHEPKAVLAKSMGLCLLVIMIGVENEQTYSLLFFCQLVYWRDFFHSGDDARLATTRLIPARGSISGHDDPILSQHRISALEGRHRCQS